MPASAFEKPVSPILQKSQLTDGLVLAMPHAEKAGSVTADLSGKNNKGTLSGSYSWVDGAFGKCPHYFNGAHTDCGNGPSLQITSDVWMGAWVYPTGFGNNGFGGRIISKLTNSPYNGYELFYGNGPPNQTGLTVQFGNAGTVNFLIGFAGLVPLNTWTRVDGWLIGTVMNMAVNAVLITSFASPGRTGSATIGSSSANLWVGDWPGSPGTANFDGHIDMPMVYNRGPRAGEIEALYADSARIYRRKSWSAEKLRPRIVMPTTLQPSYGTKTTLLNALASLTNTSSYQTNAVDNTSDLFMQMKVQVQFTTPGSGLSAASVVNIYVVASKDGTTWPGEGSGNNDGVTGVAGSITLESPTNLTKIAAIAAPTASKTYQSDWIEITVPYMGVVPPHWAIVVENQVGGTITSVSVLYHGVALVGT